MIAFLDAFLIFVFAFLGPVLLYFSYEYYKISKEAKKYVEGSIWKTRAGNLFYINHKVDSGEPVIKYIEIDEIIPEEMSSAENMYYEYIGHKSDYPELFL